MRISTSGRNAWESAREAYAMHSGAFGSAVKKTLEHPRADTQARTDFQSRLKVHEAAGRPIIDLDESGFAQDMPRCYGYALKGQRCHGKHNWQAKGRINVIGA